MIETDQIKFFRPRRNERRSIGSLFMLLHAIIRKLAQTPPDLAFTCGGLDQLSHRLIAGQRSPPRIQRCWRPDARGAHTCDRPEATLGLQAIVGLPVFVSKHESLRWLIYNQPITAHDDSLVQHCYWEEACRHQCCQRKKLCC